MRSLILLGLKQLLIVRNVLLGTTVPIVHHWPRLLHAQLVNIVTLVVLQLQVMEHAHQDHSVLLEPMNHSCVLQVNSVQQLVSQLLREAVLQGLTVLKDPHQPLKLIAQQVHTVLLVRELSQNVLQVPITQLLGRLC